MKGLLFIILLMSGIRSQAQTTAQRLSALEKSVIAINKRIDTTNMAVSKLLAISQVQDEKIKVLQDSLTTFKNGIVMSNQIVGYGPIIVRDSTATIKVIELKK